MAAYSMGTGSSYAAQGLQTSSMMRGIKSAPRHELVHNSSIYQDTLMEPKSMGLTANDLLKVKVVVPYNAQRDGDFDVEDTKARLVLYQDRVYALTVQDEATVGDEVLRTISLEEALINFEQLQPVANTIQPAFPQPGTPRPAGTQGQLILRPDVNAILISIELPALVQPNPNYLVSLPYLFDLPESQHMGIEAFQPAPFNDPVLRQVTIKADGTVKKSRIAWDPQHLLVLLRLAERALRILGRPLRRRDYLALTEALHRRLQGPGYPIRGMNTVQTKLDRTVGYKQMVEYLGLATAVPTSDD